MTEPLPEPAIHADLPGAEARRVDPQMALMTTPLRSLLRHAPVMLPPTASIVSAAQLMREQRVSSVLVVDGQRLVGIVTDRDLRSRVVAEALPPHGPLADIATPAPLCLPAQATGFDALLLMTRHNIHHLPVLETTPEGTRVAGMVSFSDLQVQQDNSAVFLAGEIFRQNDVQGLVLTSTRIRNLQRHLAAADATAYASGHVISAITDALTTRLLELATARFGPPPLAYAWVAAGSQARGEQTARSDQDNCLVLDDAFDSDQHDSYFEPLARFVCDGLDACGYVHCPGDIMAMTDAWRQPLRRWTQYFENWIDRPEPKALLWSCVFFDQRAVYGDSTLLERLRTEVLQRARGNALFLAHMAGNALSHEPPLGLFGGIKTARGGEHQGTVDLKRFGIAPIVELVRVYALAAGDAAVNTYDRLEGAAAGGEVSAGSARDLRGALEFLAALRIRHQARQLEAGQGADNFLVLDDLSQFERGQLKDAFAVVRMLQQVLRQRYRGVLP
ncbi:MAG: putative nucleotidyltransferase substrate binding domain-containing protein [Rubrivivax sp.]